MIRSALAKAVPTVGTIVAVLYTRERKGWAWAVPAGVLAHFTSAWVTSKLLGAMEGDSKLPVKPVELTDNTVVPPLETNDASSFSGSQEGVTGLRNPTKPVEIIDVANNVIKLPTAMGEP